MPTVTFAVAITETREKADYAMACDVSACQVCTGTSICSSIGMISQAAESANNLRNNLLCRSCPDRTPEIEIANTIENFVANEFIFIAKPIFIQDVIATNDYRVV